MTVEPIGIIHTPFVQAAGTPIQPVAAKGAEGHVHVYEAYRPGLADLDGFDRIWIVSWFDRAARPRLRVTPFLDDVERGLFATRAPSRPNPIGISSVRLLGLDDGVLHVADVDMLDGTPLLDIKPYAPRFDCFEVQRCGWLDDRKAEPGLADDRFTDRGGRKA